MKIVILGSSGQLGSEFVSYLKNNNKYAIYPFSHNELNIINYPELAEKISHIKPDVVINCAAYTKVDKAEDEPEECIRVNAIGARNAAFAAYKAGAKIVYYSTDYIFDGKQNNPYKEFDAPCPLSVYGKSKYYGEEYTKSVNPDYLILRVSWLYGIIGNNFIKTVIKLSRDKKELKMVDDQYGAPTYTLDVVKQTVELLNYDKVGTYHSANQGSASWYKYALTIINALDFKDISIVPIKMNEYKSKAIRPKYSVLDNYLLNVEGINIMRDWQTALSDYINTYRKQLLTIAA
ncbi:MAG: dTDP-4-dehydrorhamnose reductase [Sulfolobaceae archaeon]